MTEPCYSGFASTRTAARIAGSLPLLIKSFQQSGVSVQLWTSACSIRFTQVVYRAFSLLAARVDDRTLLQRFCVDQDGGENRWFLAAIHPGVIGSALYHHVKRLEVHRPFIE